MQRSWASAVWHLSLSILVFYLIVTLPSSVLAKEGPNRRGVAFFEKRIRPVLVKHCYKCHSRQSEEIKGGLLLDTQQGLRKGGDTGPAVVPKNLKQSLLIDSIEYKSFEMPPDGKLPANVIDDF